MRPQNKTKNPTQNMNSYICYKHFDTKVGKLCSLFVQTYSALHSSEGMSDSQKEKKKRKKEKKKKVHKEESQTHRLIGCIDKSLLKK